MSDIGISSSCYYPLVTEQAFRRVCETGAKTAERVPTTTSAMPRLTRFHSSSRSDMESPLWSTATRFPVHGIKNISKLPDALYFERYRILMDEAKKYGVTFAQENVVLHRGEDPDYLLNMKKALGEDFRVVLDLKQARRAKVEISDFLQKAGKMICHVHVSDGSGTHDCLPPGEGNVDFAAFFAAMEKLAYRGDYIIELYSDGYTRESQLTAALHRLKEARGRV